MTDEELRQIRIEALRFASMNQGVNGAEPKHFIAHAASIEKYIIKGKEPSK